MGLGLGLAKRKRKKKKRKKKEGTLLLFKTTYKYTLHKHSKNLRPHSLDKLYRLNHLLQNNQIPILHIHPRQ